MIKEWQQKILHLGLGRFHRGHQAVYYQRMAAEAGDSSWGVASFSMRSPDARDQMRKVNFKYPVVELSEKGVGLIWVDSIRAAFDAQEDFRELASQFTRSELEIITLTITEKGYCLDGQGKLDLSHASIKADLQHADEPASALGLLAYGLKLRSQQKLPGVTILSCDNLRENGKKLEAAIKSYLAAAGWDDVLSWVNSNTTFPNSMVDRIVPALTPESITDYESRFGLKPNSGLIATEEFSQWVIEDRFQRERPRWEMVGVQFVEDVRPFEEMKLRMLNASHSFLAYAGILKGYQYVHEAITDSSLQSKVELLMLREVVPLLTIPEGFDVVAYEESLIARFRNNQLPHQLKQIAMDGTQKLPQRIIPSLVEAHLMNSSKEVLIATVCAWLNYTWKILGYRPEELDDPMRDTLKNLKHTDRFSWFQEVMETTPFEALKSREELKKIIIQKASTYSLLL